MLNFTDIANKKIADIEAVPLPPMGMYRWVITKLPTVRDFDAKDGTPYQAVEFPIQVTAAGDDVELDGYKGKITDYKDRLTFMFNRNDEVNFAQFENRLKRFFVNILGCVDENATLAEGINASVKQQFMAGITWAPDKNEPEIMRATVGNPAPLE